ncbi:DNA replication complex subunit Gins51 [Haloparvum sp. AD34]
MNLDELRSVQAKERRKDSLQHLRDDFYDDVAAYIADLKAARDRRADEVEKPFQDDDVRRMSDEIETAEEVAEALYERRVGKVVKLASFEAADMPVEQEGMTSQERALFDDLVARISENKASVLDVLTGDSEPSNTGTDAANAAGAAGESTSSTAPEPEPNIASDQPAAVDPADEAGEAAEPDDGTLADAMGVGGGSDAPEGGESETAPGPDTTESAPSPSSDEPAESAPPGHSPVEPDTAPPGAEDAGSAEATDSTASAGRATSATAESESSEESPATTAASPATADDSATEMDETERTTVRITADVGDIFGVDEREYDLASEDVVTLPEANAEALLQRDAAERLE